MHLYVIKNTSTIYLFLLVKKDKILLTYKVYKILYMCKFVFQCFSVSYTNNNCSNNSSDISTNGSSSSGNSSGISILSQ